MNCELGLQLACAGQPYVETYHDYVRVAQQILNWLKPNGIQEYDFVPTFFENEFVMPSELLKKEGSTQICGVKTALTSILTAVLTKNGGPTVLSGAFWVVK